MKAKKILILAVLLLLTGLATSCEKDNYKSEFEKKVYELAKTQKKVDFNGFISDMQRGIFICYEYECVEKNGDRSGMMDGGTWVDDMSFSSDGNGKIYFNPNYDPSIHFYRTIKWKTSGNNTIELYAPYFDNSASNHVAARTQLELLYYKNGHFAMKGTQPYSYTGPTIIDYILIEGYIRFDQETLDEYAAYKPYENIEFIN